MRSVWHAIVSSSIALGVAVGATACADSTGPGRLELFRNRAKWSARGPVSYTFEYRRVCGECLPEWVQLVRITVVDGAVTSVVKIPSEEAVPAPAFRLTIDSLFIAIANVIEGRPYRFNAMYDPRLGYPLSVTADLDKQMVDDDWGFSVQNLTTEVAAP